MLIFVNVLYYFYVTVLVFFIVTDYNDLFVFSNKTYHTTYCNVLNAMINEAKDLVSVKAITYGMEITDEKYLEVMSKINESKNALLTYVEKKFNTSGE